MATCPYCQSAIDADNPALLCERIEEALKNRWHCAESDGEYYAWPVGRTIDVDGVGPAEVIAKKVKVETSELSDGYYSGGEELPQGTTFETFVVLKIGEKFFKKTGEGDSYSEIAWNGAVKPVTPKSETRVVYTFG